MATMAPRSVQISLPEELLASLDDRDETRKKGRSAVVQRALTLYLELDRQHAIDNAYARAYGGNAEEVLEEFAGLMEGQVWPTK
jgi:metal-responsive CopG/Arc/MetJ family transcriptional regulator